MAQMRTLFVPCENDRCSRPATHIIVDGYGRRVGDYCVRHAEMRLAEVNRRERPVDWEQAEKAVEGGCPSVLWGKGE